MSRFRQLGKVSAFMTYRNYLTTVFALCSALGILAGCGSSSGSDEITEPEPIDPIGEEICERGAILVDGSCQATVATAELTGPSELEVSQAGSYQAGLTFNDGSAAPIGTIFEFYADDVLVQSGTSRALNFHAPDTTGTVNLKVVAKYLPTFVATHDHDGEDGVAPEVPADEAPEADGSDDDSAAAAESDTEAEETPATEETESGLHHELVTVESAVLAVTITSNARDNVEPTVRAIPAEVTLKGPESGAVIAGEAVTFTATAKVAGGTPIFRFFLNEAVVGEGDRPDERFVEGTAADGAFTASVDLITTRDMVGPHTVRVEVAFEQGQVLADDELDFRVLVGRPEATLTLNGADYLHNDCYYAYLATVDQSAINPYTLEIEAATFLYRFSIDDNVVRNWSQDREFWLDVDTLELDDGTYDLKVEVTEAYGADPLLAQTLSITVTDDRDLSNCSEETAIREADGIEAIADRDADGIADGEDNCIDVWNPFQEDFDEDDIGDRCSICSNGDELGTETFGACGENGELDTDRDNIGDATDNCPTIPNFGQADANGDGIGDACELTDPNVSCDAFPRNPCGDVNALCVDGDDTTSYSCVCKAGFRSAYVGVADDVTDVDGYRCDEDSDMVVFNARQFRTYELSKIRSIDEFTPDEQNDIEAVEAALAEGAVYRKFDRNHQHFADQVWISDGKADFEDNCPKSLNIGQEDADGNGKGDVCDTPCLDVDDDGANVCGNDAICTQDAGITACTCRPFFKTDGADGCVPMNFLESLAEMGHTTLAAALTAEGIDLAALPIEFTLFAPSDAALDGLDVDIEALKYHLVSKRDLTEIAKNDSDPIVQRTEITDGLSAVLGMHDDARGAPIGTRWVVHINDTEVATYDDYDTNANYVRAAPWRLGFGAKGRLGTAEVRIDNLRVSSETGVQFQTDFAHGEFAGNLNTYTSTFDHFEDAAGSSRTSKWLIGGDDCVDAANARQDIFLAGEEVYAESTQVLEPGALSAVEFDLGWSPRTDEFSVQFALGNLVNESGNGIIGRIIECDRVGSQNFATAVRFSMSEGAIYFPTEGGADESDAVAITIDEDAGFSLKAGDIYRVRVALENLYVGTNDIGEVAVSAFTGESGLLVNGKAKAGYPIQTQNYDIIPIDKVIGPLSVSEALQAMGAQTDSDSEENADTGCKDLAAGSYTTIFEALRDAKAPPAFTCGETCPDNNFVQNEACFACEGVEQGYAESLTRAVNDVRKEGSTSCSGDRRIVTPPECSVAEDGSVTGLLAELDQLEGAAIFGFKNHPALSFRQQLNGTTDRARWEILRHHVIPEGAAALSSWALEERNVVTSAAGYSMLIEGGKIDGKVKIEEGRIFYAKNDTILRLVKEPIFPPTLQDAINNLGDEYSYFKEAVRIFGVTLGDNGSKLCEKDYRTVMAFTNNALGAFLRNDAAFAKYLNKDVADLPPAVPNGVDGSLNTRLDLFYDNLLDLTDFQLSVAPRTNLSERGLKLTDFHVAIDTVENAESGGALSTPFGSDELMETESGYTLVVNQVDGTANGVDVELGAEPFKAVGGEVKSIDAVLAPPTVRDLLEFAGNGEYKPFLDEIIAAYALPDPRELPANNDLETLIDSTDANVAITVFAPQDNAMGQYPIGDNVVKRKDELNRYWLPGAVDSTDVIAFFNADIKVAMSNFERFELAYDEIQEQFLLGSAKAKISTLDLRGVNGLVHGIEALHNPPAPIEYGGDCDDGDRTLDNGFDSDDKDCDGVPSQQSLVALVSKGQAVDATQAEIQAGETAELQLNQLRYDCRDDNPDLGIRSNDKDCDGIVTNDDCFDGGATGNELQAVTGLNGQAVGARALDRDCDGVPGAINALDIQSNEDCDDTNPDRGPLGNDFDCDGVPNDKDCKPNDETLRTSTDADADCDGAVSEQYLDGLIADGENADPNDPADQTVIQAGFDATAQKARYEYDCDDNLSRLGIKSDDLDCDGFPKAQNVNNIQVFEDCWDGGFNGEQPHPTTGLSGAELGLNAYDSDCDGVNRGETDDVAWVPVPGRAALISAEDCEVSSASSNELEANNPEYGVCNESTIGEFVFEPSGNQLQNGKEFVLAGYGGIGDAANGAVGSVFPQSDTRIEWSGAKRESCSAASETIEEVDVTVWTCQRVYQ